MKKTYQVTLAGLMIFTGCSMSKPELGVKHGELMPCPKTPNCVSSQAVDEEHYIQPIHFFGTRQEARSRLLQILKSEKRTKILTDQENYIRVEFTTALFRFIDDVEFYIPEKQDTETVIHIRSASRVGSYDLGVNRKRMERIRSIF